MISFCFLFDRELIDACLRIDLPRFQQYAGEVSAVGAVGEVLALEADGASLGDGRAVNALEAVVPIAGIDLHAGFGGEDLHAAACDGIDALGGKGEFVGLALVEHPAMVVAGAVLGLHVVGIDALAHLVLLAEVERSALDGIDRAEGDGGVIDGDVMVSVHGQQVAFA